MTDQTVYIADIAAFLPGEPVSNDDMETILGQVGARPSRARRTVLRSNGITARHYAIDPATLEPTHSNASMTAEAVRGLVSDSFSLHDIDCLSCGTTIADQLIPNHAAMVQGELQLQRCEAVATAGVCASGISALKYAYMSIFSGQHNCAVATGSDLSSAQMHSGNFSQEIASAAEAIEKQPELVFEKDFLRWMLSDGAGAMLLQKEPRKDALSLRIDWMEILSYAGETDACMYAGATKDSEGSLQGWQRYSHQERGDNSIMTIKQDVKQLNENIVHYTVEKPLAELREKYNLRADAIDWFLPHYSSQFFRDRLLAGMRVAGLEVPQERWFTNLSTRGNTGAASMYIMLEELLHSNRLRSGQKLLCYVPESGRFSTAFFHLTVC